MVIPPEFSGLKNLEKLLAAEPSSNINCHKAVLYIAGIISFNELVSDPRKQQSEDFTFRRRALKISNKQFLPISNTTNLVKMAENEIAEGEIFIGQILDVQDKELAHSFLIARSAKGDFPYIDKIGFKEPFSTAHLETLLDFENYQNQEWRFVSITQAT